MKLPADFAGWADEAQGALGVLAELGELVAPRPRLAPGHRQPHPAEHEVGADEGDADERPAGAWGEAVHP